MPSTVEQILAAAGCRTAGVACWGDLVSLGNPGVYLVTLGDRPDSLEETLAEALISSDEGWLSARPELELDRARPSVSELSSRLSRFWLPDELILCIGLARTSTSARVGQYYSTPFVRRATP